MAPPLRSRPAPMDRFTDASASAISSGFSAAMALGPQPKVSPLSSAKKGSGEFASTSTEGVEWLRDLQSASGFGSGGGAGGGSGGAGEEDDDEDEDDSEGEGEGHAGPSKRKSSSKRKGAAGGTKKKSGGANTNGVNGNGGGGGDEEDQAAARKAQNRIAQREFRQRKQQYIRALEARVELLSSDHDTQVDRLRYALRGLLAENNQLRTFVNSLASFIGQACIGGPLQRAGMSRKELEEIIFGSSEKTMTESWQNWPGARECEALRKIRIESNLPPEGLPESLPPSAAATAATKARAAETAAAAAAAASAATTSAAADKDDEDASPGSNNNKRKSSVDEGPKKRGRKPKQQSSAMVSSPAATTTPDQSRSIPSTSSPADHAATEQRQQRQQQQQNQLLQQQQQMISFMQQQQHQQDPPEQPFMQAFAQQFVRDPQVFSQYFATGPDALNMAANNIFGASPSTLPSVDSSGMIQGQTQDSSALLASLFGPQPPLSNGLPTNLFTTTPAKVTTRQGEPDEVRRVRNLGLRVLEARKERRRARGEPDDESVALEDGAVLERQQQVVMQLAYHMANYRRQPSYELPPMLKPSEIQQTRPHDPLLDIVPFAGLRQNCIANQERIDIDDMVMVLLDNLRVHDGDAMDLSTWEIKPGFLFAYPSLIDAQTLENCNRWRRSRGQRALTFENLTMGDQSQADI